MPFYDIVSLLIIVSAALILLLLITEERDPTTTLAWALVLIFLPGLGLLIYLLFGRNWRRIARADRVRAQSERLGDEAMAPIYDRWAEAAAEALAGKPDFVRGISNAITRQNRNRPLPACDITIYDSGADKFEALFADIAAAQHHVHLEYFIWEQDDLTGRLCALLAEKVAAGVEVRVLYDWVGSLPFGKRQLSELRNAGAHVHADAAHWARLNYRNHRKVAVIDGTIAYTGGMNIGQEYIDGKPRYDSWRDTHARFRGPLVADLQRTFAERWYRVTREDLFSARYVRDLDEVGEWTVWTQLTTSGPESELEVIRNVFLLAIMSANARVRVQSPYFVPDEPIEQALITQSLAGVDVRFMMTGVPDKRIAWNAAFSYIDELVAAGGRLYQYDAGFFHAKSMTIDDELAIIGTTNFDIRSFMLHDELSVCFYDATVALHLDALFEADLERCVEIDAEHLAAMSRLGAFGNAFARMWSRLL